MPAPGPVVKGKIEYQAGELVPDEYTLADFKKAILAVVAQ